VRSEDNTVKSLKIKFEVKRFGLQITFVVVAILLLVALPLLTPHIPFWNVAKILSPLQMLYAVLSSEIALAVYMWGVGNWSRFEPPQNVSDSEPPQKDSFPGAPPATGAAAPQAKVSAPAQEGGH
jgi:hypothetical protein